ncbi:MAG: family 16 glycoside hydrolase, partial [Bacteroidota bacterium]
MRKILLLFLPLLLLLTLHNCGEEPAPTTTFSPWDSDRPHDPWVFRSVLDSQARMVTMALHDRLWVAYSAERGTFYKAWRGHVNFDGAVYTTAHGPQPTSIGDAYFINRHADPWLLREGGQERALKARYRGHVFEKGAVALRYELDLGDGQVLQVSEWPEYVESEIGQSGLERTFTVVGLRPGQSLGLRTNLSSVASAERVETNGQLDLKSTTERTLGKVRGVDIEAELWLLADTTTFLTCWFTKYPLIESPYQLAAGVTENRPEGYQLIARNDCKTCHNTYRKTIGPAYVEVAKKYRNTATNVEMLVQKVKVGGSGVWGEQVMNAHPDLDEADIQAMVEYIMELDAEEEETLANDPQQKNRDVASLDLRAATEGLDENLLFPGGVTRVYVYPQSISSVRQIDTRQEAQFTGVLPTIAAEGGDFVGLEANFAFVITGYLKIPQDRLYEFALASDDGSRLTIDDQVIINHDGFHGTTAKYGEVALAAGYHPFRIDFFQGGGGKSLFLEWKAPGETSFSHVPSTVIVHHRDQKTSTGQPLAMASNRRIPGDGYPLEKVHPSYDLSQARPDIFTPKVGGIDFLSDGRMVVSTWDAAGSVFIVDGVQGGNPAQITVKTIAKGCAEPLGLKVVDDEIYVLQKQELTKLIDHDGDEIIDEYQTVCNAWRVSANFHEFAFGLAYQNGYFYATLATAIEPGGASTSPQIPDRGKVVKISRTDGSHEFLAHGLRTPNGIGIGVDDELFVADNQGDWLPACKIVHVQRGAWYGSHSVDPVGTASLEETRPVVWLPQDEIGNSPSTPLAINDGPYRGQMIHGEVTHGGVKRVFVEKVKGQYQGAVFRFIQGLEAGVNRICWGPDGALYTGGIGSSGNWGHTGKLWYGLQRLQFNGESTFEMLAVRAKSDGIEIEFTEPLRPGEGWSAADYLVKQWYYQPTKEYGGPKLDETILPARSVSVSEDRKRVFLALDGLREKHIVYVQLQNSPVSDLGHELWSTEAWYTLNNIPADRPGFRREAPAPPALNTLSAAEAAAGWKLLFDGKSTAGWRNYGKSTIGKSWIIDDGALMLDAQPRDDGGWQAADGGDIITEEEYENFELSLEWRIGNCGNSGIIYHVHESEDYGYVWQTGPEMQVLDNSCHPDGKYATHRAGDLYDMIECEYLSVLPAGSWNKVRLVVDNGRAEHWLNGRKVVTYTLGDESWKARIRDSKFAEMPGFGSYTKGHLALQDHG